jgi:hypothetical protein
MMPTTKNPGGHRGSDEEMEQDKSDPVAPIRQPLRERLPRQTVPYLAALLGCSEDDAWMRPVTWQVFDDTKAKDQNRAEIIHGCLAALADDLERRNVRGDGIYIAVNETNLQGRKKQDIIKIRSLWADLDAKDAVLPFDLGAVPLPPSLVVKSGHGHHLYWILPEFVPCDKSLQDEAEALLRGIQRKLKDFGADPQVCQVAAVLRVPGFFNMKREPVLVEVLR